MKRWIALALALLLCLSLAACGKDGGAGKSAGKAAEPAALRGKVTEDGTAYLPCMNGEVFEIKGDAVSAWLLADRKTAVVLEEDGRLYFTVKGQEEKTEIADNATEINAVRATGVLYTAGGELMRYTFADGQSVSFGKDMAVAVAENTLALVLADDEGSILIAPESAGEAEKIGSYDDSVYVEEVSNDGTTAVWVDKDTSEDTLTIFLYADGERTKLGTADSSYDYTNAVIANDGSFVAVANGYFDTLYWKLKDGEVVSARLGDTLASSTMYNAAGRLDTNSTSCEGLYVMVEGSDGNSLYYIDSEGGREKLVSKVDTYQVAAGVLCYLTEEKELYRTKVDGAKLEEEEKIAGDVECFELSENGSYVYYLKNYDQEEQTGALYRLDLTKKDAETEKIASDAYSMYFNYLDILLQNFYVTDDGKSVYYFRNVEEIAGTYSDSGTLMMATVGSEEPVKIGTEVLVGAPTSARKDESLDAKSILFEKYITTDENDEVIANWMYWNGTEAAVMGREVYHSADAVGVQAHAAETTADTADTTPADTADTFWS